MKKTISSLLLLSLILTLFSAALPAFAADADAPGIYDFVPVEGYTVTPQDAAGNEVTSIKANIDGVEKDFYPNAERFAVSYAHSDASTFHLVLALNDETKIPTTGNIMYIDQTTAKASKVDFDVFPKTMGEGLYHIYVSLSNGGGLVDVASFRYNQPIMLGDMDFDKDVDTLDALYILQASVSKDPLPALKQLAADFNQDGVVNSLDALAVLQFSVSVQ